jgi:non-ribosomal peptide synthase protein (TIGR01720 family)
MRFYYEGEEWHQHNGEPLGYLDILTEVDLRNVVPEEAGHSLETSASEAQQTFCLEKGALCRGIFFHMPPGTRNRILLIVHHLVIDGVSWRVILEDLNRLCRQEMGGIATHLPLKTTSFQSWALQIGSYADDGGFDGELDHWLSTSQAPVPPLPRDFHDGVNTTSSSSMLRLDLSESDTTKLLNSIASQYKRPLFEILLASFGRALAEWTGNRNIRLDIEGHGREDILSGVNLTRTVGWFTTIYPLHIELPFSLSAQEALTHLSAQLEKTPSRGLGYGYLRARYQALSRFPAAEISFNYLGTFSQSETTATLLKVINEPIGETQGVTGTRPYLLEVNSILAEGCLRVQWTYSSAIHDTKTVQRLSQLFSDALDSYIGEHFVDEAAPVVDYPLAALTKADVLTILEQVSQASSVAKQ